MTINRNDMWKLGTLSVAPFDWFEASYFYYRPADLIWNDGDGIAGHDLDKGFNVKFSYQPSLSFMPRFAVGFDDLAGTGYFSREYIVSTYDFNHFKFSLGAGWGKYNTGKGISNPLGIISDRFRDRSTADGSYGGTLNIGQWFTGDVSFFGGIEWFIPYGRGLKFKLERDPFNYFDLSAGFREDASFSRRKSDSNYNFGFSFPIKKYGFIDISYIKGNTLNLSLTLGATFNDKLVKKKKFEPKISNGSNNKISFYDDLLFNLNQNKILLQTASLKELQKINELDIAIINGVYSSPIRYSSYASYIASKVAENHDLDINKINVTNMVLGMETNKISYLRKDVDSLTKKPPIELVQKRTELKPGNKKDYLSKEFKPKVVFPAVFQSISPNLVSHIGNPQRFYYGGIVLQYESEVQFSRSFTLTSNLKFNLSDNFQDTLTGPGSDFLPHVRTDLMEYLKSSDKYVSRMQLDYLWSPKKEFYAKVSAGIFEMMYGGIGTEVLYKPFDSKLMVGLEVFKVKKRAFDQKFNFLDYETTTGHINFNYNFERFGLIANLSFGKYLAKDKGYTLDLSRRTKSGFRAGIFFTRTNVSAAEFGEGSFDKGFYFKIPFNLFSKEYTQQSFNFKLSPLTRDGGAKLTHDKRLIDLINNATYYEINRGWNGFLD